ncbi:hypothetical protein LX15_001706 [Streptoalloteichus tenebrarius]|uniref:Uncharacterized protein n=1 Tax=Streptoalloteichus tenebrarius (strain ATCC 17920 / DSM 40477 / JCM 4838 / CBS 697.72 / NBRC 16177 / NCIMB 11028 / NRRL B-12390 / A12253. 1 / ISP 5477) TaxID=1933 RepID=A0ABT1HR82_STRSD|nr:hypothetical protein [Streptoalloteichus tenebrarius]MCP2258019.1 hypothetical protein [Streptoalloteichus tenebrarius]BFF01687.1 hypothetical protein GCM10020241_33620 [Streptoalloteichus tenebrarius]
MRSARQCHELLLRLAGRLPDEPLWRYRDWLAGGASDVLVRALPRTLLHDRIGLTAHEHRLALALVPEGADPAMVAALPVRDGPPAPAHVFDGTPPGGADHADQPLVVVTAALRGRSTVREIRCSWRRDADGAARRVLLVTATADHAGLAGELQRVLRALGERVPRVEVLPTDLHDLPDYHRAALASSELVGVGADVVRA